MYGALVSGLLLVFHILVSRQFVRDAYQNLCHGGQNADAQGPSIANDALAREATLRAELHERMKKHGGSTIFAFKCVRLVGCIVFLGLYIYSTMIEEGSHLDGGLWSDLGKKKKKKHPKGDPTFSHKEWQDLAICLTSVSYLPHS